MKCICIDSSNKPAKISQDEWIKEGTTYTITKIIKMGIQDGVYGVLLKEVQLSQQSFPYEYYDADRFIPLDIRLHKEEEAEVKEADLELV